MKINDLPVGKLPLMVILTMFCHANACKEFKAKREPIAIIRYQDSSVLSAKLSDGISGVGNRLPLDDGSTVKKNRESPFKGLYVIQGKPPKVDSLLDCNIGVESTKYAQLVRGGIFVKITTTDLLKAKGKSLTWNDLRVFMDLGIKLPTPNSINDIKHMLEKDSIRIDTIFPAKEKYSRDPWFGVFYKETTLKSYIYGIKYAFRNDTLKYLYHEPYFGFKRTYISNDWLDGASAVYIPNTPEYKNEQKLESFIVKVHE